MILCDKNWGSGAWEGCEVSSIDYTLTCRSHSQVSHYSFPGFSLKALSPWFHSQALSLQSQFLVPMEVPRLQPPPPPSPPQPLLHNAIKAGGWSLGTRLRNIVLVYTSYALLSFVPSLHCQFFFFPTCNKKRKEKKLAVETGNEATYSCRQRLWR